MGPPDVGSCKPVVDLPVVEAPLVVEPVEAFCQSWLHPLEECCQSWLDPSDATFCEVVVDVFPVEALLVVEPVEECCPWWLDPPDAETCDPVVEVSLVLVDVSLVEALPLLVVLVVCEPGAVVTSDPAGLGVVSPGVVSGPEAGVVGVVVVVVPPVPIG